MTMINPIPKIPGSNSENKDLKSSGFNSQSEDAFRAPRPLAKTDREIRLEAIVSDLVIVAEAHHNALKNYEPGRWS
jgi:hypothetical protein